MAPASRGTIKEELYTRNYKRGTISIYEELYTRSYGRGTIYEELTYEALYTRNYIRGAIRGAIKDKL